MNILCSICRDAFTGEDNEAIYSTNCGHVFHHHCLAQWMERTKTCPHCRAKLTNKSTFKLNLFIEGTAGPKTGVEGHEARNLQFQLTMKDIEVRQLREASAIATEQSKGLRLEVKKLEDQVKNNHSKECNLIQEIQNLKAELRSEQQKNSRQGVPRPNDVPFDVIDLDDSDPELILDIDANLQEMRRNAPDEDQDVIDLDASLRQQNNRPHDNQEVQDLKNELELKEVLLASAVARIRELEENRPRMMNSSWN